MSLRIDIIWNDSLRDMMMVCLVKMSEGLTIKPQQDKTDSDDVFLPLMCGYCFFGRCLFAYAMAVLYITRCQEILQRIRPRSICVCVSRQFHWLVFSSSCQNHEKSNSLQLLFELLFNGSYWCIFLFTFFAWCFDCCSSIWSCVCVCVYSASFAEDMDIEMWTEVSVVVVRLLIYLSDEQI